MKDQHKAYQECFYSTKKAAFNAHQIIYAEASEKCVVITYRADDGRTKEAMFNNLSLSKLKKDHEGGFVSISRSILVNVSLIDALFPVSDKEWAVSVSHVPKTLPVSRRTVKSLRKLLDNRP